MSATSDGGGAASATASASASPSPPPATSAAAPEKPVPASLAGLAARIENSYVRDLHADPDQGKHAPNKTRREVFSGHYVRVAPTPLSAPYLVAFSEDLARTLGLEAADVASEAFVRVFSGDIAGASVGGGFEALGWATPYALSIYGSEQIPPGAGSRGYGYGDGRAISIAEVLLPAPPARAGARLELQLKGAGTTPFCRGADGSAVLRSSAREFIASEAMHHLGVATTRALSLIASASDSIMRVWYSEEAVEMGAKHGGDVMVKNRRAITTRVAASFLRVGQFELYGRRARAGDVTGLAELALLARHALDREYPEHAVPADAPPAALQTAVLGMLRSASVRFAALAANWLRVGYVQSNFNADNCLVGGVTMDYGPFGFLEKYDPDWGMWVASGDHFAYMNQPTAAGVNFSMLIKSLAHLFDAAGVAEARAILREHEAVSEHAVDTMWARKMGFPAGSAPVATTKALFERLERTMRAHPTDFTILYRQLMYALPEEGGDFAAAVAAAAHDAAAAEAEVAASKAAAGGAGAPASAADAGEAPTCALPPRRHTGALAHLEAAFYGPLPARMVPVWRRWLADWLAALKASGTSAGEARATMRKTNPKFIPRESLLVEAYTAAETGDHAPLLALHEVLKRPYEDQPGADPKYYKRAVDGSEKKPGTGFMP